MLPILFQAVTHLKQRGALFISTALRRILFDHLDEIVEAWNEFQESTND
jgi:hypothetical protein